MKVTQLHNEFLEIFLKYSLEGLPKKILITDGHMAYPPIIERICIKQQLCIFHIIKNHHDKSYKIINKIQRRIKSLETKINKNEERIQRIKNKSKEINEKRRSIKDITRQNRIKTRKKLEKQTRQLRRDLSEKRKELQDQESITERIRAIYDTDTEKAAKQRFNTIYNKINQFDKNTQNFLKTLKKKFNKTTEYHKNPQIPRTNNKIEGYFKITLPSHLKRTFRTQKGLIRWIRLQKARWTQRNVVYNLN